MLSKFAFMAACIAVGAAVSPAMANSGGNPFLPPERLTKSQEQLVRDILQTEMGRVIADAQRTAESAVDRRLGTSGTGMPGDPNGLMANDQVKDMIRSIIQEELTKGVTDFVPLGVDPNGATGGAGAEGGVKAADAEREGTFIGCVDGKPVYKKDGKMKTYNSDAGECR